jgi:electron transport complex protein RnfE
MGLGFLLALFIMATLREFFGNGSFAGFVIPFMENFKIPVLTQAPGGFLVFGIVIGVMNKITAKRGGVRRKSFSCEACPTAHLCNKEGCGEAEQSRDAVKEDAE